MFQIEAKTSVLLYNRKDFIRKVGLFRKQWWSLEIRGDILRNSKEYLTERQEKS